MKGKTLTVGVLTDIIYSRMYINRGIAAHTKLGFPILFLCQAYGRRHKSLWAEKLFESSIFLISMKLLIRYGINEVIYSKVILTFI